MLLELIVKVCEQFISFFDFFGGRQDDIVSFEGKYRPVRVHTQI